MNNNPLTDLISSILNQVFFYIMIMLLIFILFLGILHYLGVIDLKKLFKIENKQKEKIYNPFYLVSEGKIFTNTELKFFYELNLLVNNKDYYLFTKVRLVDLVNIRKAEYSKYMSIFNKLSKKHIDFIIVDKYGKIKILIELDDKYHNSNKAKINDKFKNDLALYLNIPLIRYSVSNNYNFENLKKILV